MNGCHRFSCKRGARATLETQRKVGELLADMVRDPLEGRPVSVNVVHTFSLKDFAEELGISESAAPELPSKPEKNVTQGDISSH